MLRKYLLSLGSSLLLLSATAQSTMNKPDYPIQPVPFTAVKVQDKFWAPRIQRNHEVTIPIALDQCYKTGRVDNFLVAGGLKEGKFCTTYPFDDTDIYKILEGASYSIQTFPDAALEAKLDSLIYYIGEAQEPDGYLYTNRTIDPFNTHEWAGPNRWEKTSDLSHELYNCGHLYEAAVAHYQATGKRSLLDIALKNADLLLQTFGPDGLHYYPGHQIVEMGLVKLYRITGKKDYLDLAKFFLEARENGKEYDQSHIKVTEQREPVGHAVRATYMYSGMADVAALTNDNAYRTAMEAIWNDLVQKKLYLTGGIGAAAGHEGFAAPYELPNMTAYNETCASIGEIYWNHRLFLLYGDAKYYDILERTLYNGMISGVSLSGDHFFYPNPLESIGQHERSEWFGCACCPSNVCRFVPSVPGYVYAVNDNRLYANLFVASTATVELSATPVEIIQQTDYPWQGDVNFAVNPQQAGAFELAIRIPGWATNQAVPSDLYHFKNPITAAPQLFVNGKVVEYKTENGYAIINRSWQKGDKVNLSLPMPVQLVQANENVQADKDRVALQRGPVVYCLEWKEYEDGKVRNLLLNEEAELTASYTPDTLGGITTVSGTAKKLSYSDDGKLVEKTTDFTAIPYYAWANRGAGEMVVWIPTEPTAMQLPKPTLAFNSKIEASYPTKAIKALNDQSPIANSNDKSSLHYHWWPMKDTVQWVQYTFNEPATVSSAKVYWFDDTPWGGCRIPASWKILYQDAAGEWKAVKATSGYPISKDEFNSVSFEPVKTSALRLEVELSKEYSSGILEWIVE